jgi:hypothetical protein
MDNVFYSDWQDVRESVSLDGAFVDPREALWDDGEGIMWMAIGAGPESANTRQKTGLCTESELENARNLSRYICDKSPFAISAIENRISYVVGYGHTYKAVAKAGLTASESTIAKAQEILDRFCKVNRWNWRQQEIVRRYDRDGEVFLRRFEGTDGTLRVRFIEPNQVATPEGKTTDASCSFGIRTEPDDVESILSYFIDGAEVEAAEIQHRKANVDCNVKRGKPTFYCVVTSLCNAEKVERNIIKGSAMQTAYAYVEQNEGLSADGVQNLASARADFTRTNTITNKLERLEIHKAGMILRARAGKKLEFPFKDTNYAQYLEAIAFSLRKVAAMLVMPEWMLTSDASNMGAYTSSMVAESPSVRMFERHQYYHREYDLELLEAQLALSVVKGELTQAEVDSIEVQAECPEVAARDRQVEAGVRQVLYMNGIMSAQYWSMLEGLDYDQEQKNIEEHRAAHPDAMLDPLGTGANAGDEDEDQEKDKADADAE